MADKTSPADKPADKKKSGKKTLRSVRIEPAKNGHTVEAHYSDSNEMYMSEPERTVHESMDSALEAVKRHLTKATKPKHE